MTDPTPVATLPTPVVELRGDIGPDLADYARQKAAHVLAALGRPVDRVHLHVLHHRDPAREHPVRASVTVDVAGRRVHAHVTADHPREAVDLLLDRMRRRVLRARPNRRRPHRRRRASVDARITRREVVEAVPYDVEEAVAFLVDLGQRVHLFRDRATGRPAVVDRGGPTGLRVTHLAGPPSTDPPAGVTVAASSPRRMRTGRAVDQLTLAGLDRLFFRDPGHGARLLRRDPDGGLVLVELADGGPADPGPLAPRERDPEP